MNIIAKQIQRSDIVFLFNAGPLVLPEPAQLFSLYPGEAGKGSMSSDNAAMGVRIFEFPAPGLQWVFERNRVRLEDRASRTPAESQLGPEAIRAMLALYPGVAPTAHGFNYDIIYRMDNVIPVSDIMSSFVGADATEDIQSFGWQYTLSREKGKYTETYFFKVVSPIEFAVHVNFQTNTPGLPHAKSLQTAFQHSYEAADESLKRLSF